MATPRSYVTGVDVGGTFTDLVAVDRETGEVVVNKELSTPADPSRGVAHVLERSDLHPDGIDHLVHGSTTAVNTILERDGARTALVTTAGFSDLLEIGRLMKPELYSLDWEQTDPLVPRKRRIGVPERIDADGEVVRALDEERATTAVERLRDQGVESYAVCFLFSFVNDEHERRMQDLIREVHPEASVTVSADILPEIREFPRTSTVVANAYILPRMTDYFSRLVGQLDGAEVTEEPLVMRSNGGVMTIDTAERVPVETFDSGPAGGVTAAAQLGAELDEPNVIALDMGGTSCEVGVVSDGSPLINLESEIEFEMPIKIPVVDVQSIGAGGGSIAWIDDTGILQVGPESAGADPGPVCYGRGGTEPTITDANVILGRLNQSELLGGELSVDYDAAVDRIEERLVDRLGMDLDKVCQGIMEISQTNMAMLARKMTIERGYDPRDFVLVAYGGAGPMVANKVAAEIDVGTVIVPPNPGVFSAFGCMSADARHDSAKSYLSPLSAVDPETVAAEFAALTADSIDELGARDDPAVDISYKMDLRYVGEAYEITTPLSGTDVGEDTLTETAERFHDLHEERYAYKRPDDPVELVSLRTTVTEEVPTPEYSADFESPARTRRECYFEETGFTEVPVRNRAALDEDNGAEGPLIVEEPTSTTVVFPGQTARVDDRANLIIATQP